MPALREKRTWDGSPIFGLSRGESLFGRRRGMHGRMLFALVVLGLVLAGCASTRQGGSTYTLNGKQVVMSGLQKMNTPKGIETVVEGEGLNVTLSGEEEITINGRRFRAYGEKVEVDGEPFPVGQGKTLEVLENGDILIRGAVGPGAGVAPPPE